jgi:predicted P-loop ATPase
MEIDRIQHEIQLKTLGYTDGEQVFYRSIPGKGFKDKTIKRTTTFPTLPKEQNEQRGLYFVVNGQGDKDEDISTCRAFFCEWDDRPIEQQLTAWQDKGFLEPTFQVQTRKSVHCYWVLSEPIPVDDWKILQANLLNALDGDRNLKNPSRVLRVAGAWHVKAGEEPIKCALINTRPENKYSQAQIEAALEKYAIEIPPSPPSPPSLKNAKVETSIIPPIPLINCLPKRDRLLIETGAGNGSRNQNGYGLAKDLIATENYLRTEGISYCDNAFSLFMFYCQNCDQTDWTSKEWDQVWKSAEKDAPVNPPLEPDMIDNCLRKHAKEQGIKLPAKPVLTSSPLAIPQPETARVYGGPKGLNSGELARFVEDNIAHRLSFDELRTEVLLDGEKIILGNDLKFWFLKQFGELATKEDIYDCMTYYARQNSFNPLEKYLNSLDCEPVPIYDLATRYFGRTEPIYNRMVELWLISCVARALTRLDDPNQQGTQVDHTLILQSGQGKYKSTWFKTLGGKWFSDSVKDIESKDSLMIVHSNWIIELSELDRITSRKQAGAIKHWLTQRTDSYRKPYAREIEPNLPRRCVFCGTVNPERFLVDDENRRFWIVPIADHIPALDIPQLERERDGIWRAAFLAYQSGQAWWPTEEEKGAIALMAQDFKETDAWQEEIEPYLLGKEFVSSLEILTDCLKFETHQVKRADEMRVSKILDGLGWGKTTRKWENDPLTGKKVARRVRLAPKSSDNSKGWINGSSQVGQAFGVDPTKKQDGSGWINSNGHDPTIQPHDPTLESPQTQSGQGMIQGSDMIHHFPNSGNGKIEIPAEIADAIFALNVERDRIGWSKEQLKSEAARLYGKTEILSFTESELLDLLKKLAALPTVITHDPLN